MCYRLHGGLGGLGLSLRALWPCLCCASFRRLGDFPRYHLGILRSGPSASLSVPELPSAAGLCSHLSAVSTSGARAEPVLSAGSVDKLQVRRCGRLCRRSSPTPAESGREVKLPGGQPCSPASGAAQVAETRVPGGAGPTPESSTTKPGARSEAGADPSVQAGMGPPGVWRCPLVTE